MISYAGEAAVSGVSLVNSINTLFLNLFTAWASGGAVVVSQYIGRKDRDNGNKACSQLLMFSIVFSLIISVLILINGNSILVLLFGKVESDVMSASQIYLRITTYSYVFMAIYNAGGSVLRSMGRTKETMVVSMIANIINIIGNFIGVFILHAGVSGVAWPTFISRLVQAIIITLFCISEKNEVHYVLRYVIMWNGELLKKIFNIAIPNSIESAIFNLVKILLSSVVAGFGTIQTAAHGVAQNIWSISNISSNAMGPIFVTVIGQYMGARDTKGARSSFWKLLKITSSISIIWNFMMIALTPFILNFYNISDEAKYYVMIIVAIHDSFNAFFMPFSGPLGNGLRACGDVKFTMVWAIVASVCGRLVLTYVFALWMNLGVIGVTMAMVSDWIVRGIVYTLRLKSDKWESKIVI